MNSPSISLGKIEGLDQRKHIFSVLNFISNQLSEFVSLYKNEYSQITNENGITQKLCMFLDNRLRFNTKYNLYAISTEYMEQPESGNSPSNDIAIRIVTYNRPLDPFFIIEAKRLNSNSSELSHKGREYVIGNRKQNGGIERFKLEKHGKEFQIVGMLGYIQNNDFFYWHSFVNSLIIKYFSSTEILHPLSCCSNLLMICNSYHNRTTLPNIQIYHLWINLR